MLPKAVDRGQPALDYQLDESPSVSREQRIVSLEQAAGTSRGPQCGLEVIRALDRQRLKLHAQRAGRDLRALLLGKVAWIRGPPEDGDAPELRKVSRMLPGSLAEGHDAHQRPRPGLPGAIRALADKRNALARMVYARGLVLPCVSVGLRGER